MDTDTYTTHAAATETEDCRETLQAERRHFANAAFAFADHTAQVEQMAADCYRALEMLLTRLYEYKRSALYITPAEYKQALATLAKYKTWQPPAVESDITENELTHGWEGEEYD